MKSLRTIAALSLMLTAAAIADDAPATQPLVDYHKLKAAMPDTIAGVKRKSLEGQKIGMGGMQMSTAKAEYSTDADGSLSVRVEAVSYNNPDIAKGAAIWSQMEMDNENDDGYQKTMKIQDQPAMVEYKTKDKTGTITVLAGGIIVTAHVENCSADQLKTVEDQLPLKAIADLSK